MKRLTPKRVVSFVIVMSVIAFAIYLPFYKREQRQAQIAVQQQQAAENQVATQKAAQDAAAEHAQFLAQYVDTTFTKKPGVQTVALMVASVDGKPDRAISEVLARRFQSGAVQIMPSFFKPSFVSDGLFESAWNGAGDVSQKLELAKSLDEMLLAKESVEFSTNGPDLQNVITVTMRLDVARIPVSGNGQGQTWTLTAAGAGFSQTAARAQAEERLAKKIAADKTMSP